ncbi:MAG: sensor histidine kinase, partial [Terriglobales bacterium]
NMISHDLRSPLTSMLGSMTMINYGAYGEVSSELSSEVESVTKNINRLITFVNDILDYQKLEAGKMELELADHDLTAIISDSVTLVIELARAKEVEIKVPQGNWRVRCDGQKIVQTVVNLLSNAIKFSPAQSAVSISVDEIPGYIQLSVTDCGPGVPAEFREKIFEAFEQVPSSAKTKVGTGLGLAIAKMIMDAHGGAIGLQIEESSAKNNDGTGSTFWLRLPATDLTPRQSIHEEPLKY